LSSLTFARSLSPPLFALFLNISLSLSSLRLSHSLSDCLSAFLSHSLLSLSLSLSRPRTLSLPPPLALSLFLSLSLALSIFRVCMYVRVRER
jgi:hypothetical protein